MSEDKRTFECKNCCFFKATYESDVIKCGEVVGTVLNGECRRNPPSSGSPTFPRITGNEWCGELRWFKTDDEIEREFIK